MSIFVIQFIAFFVLALITGSLCQGGAAKNDTSSSHLVSENDGDIKKIYLDDQIETLKDRRTFTRPTTPQTLFNPTPVISTQSKPPTIFLQTSPNPKPVGSSKPTSSPLPKPVVLPTPVAAAEGNRVAICGKKKNCYKWFDEELDLTSSDGYKRCNAFDEIRAKWYCCIS